MVIVPATGPALRRAGHAERGQGSAVHGLPAVLLRRADPGRPGRPWANAVLKIPNLVARSLYVERLQELVVADLRGSGDRIQQHAEAFYLERRFGAACATSSNSAISRSSPIATTAGATNCWSRSRF
ncbi:MAG: hypothetical protein MZU95_05510 [Desulfomicrobium escambiense]|nr:hypothetical protein [Desulfomicrobium escambiense]